MVNAPFFDGRIEKSNNGQNIGSIGSGAALSGPLFVIWDYLCMVIIPAAGCFCSSGKQNLQKNVIFWNLLAAISVLLIASYRGYRKSSLLQTQKSVELAVLCYWATALLMLLVAMLLGHEHSFSRFWTSAELAGTPVLLALTRLVPFEELMGTPKFSIPDGPLIVCFDRTPDGLTKAMTEHRIPTSISGILYLAPRRPNAGSPGWPVIPGIAGLVEIVRCKNIQDIIFVHQPELELVSQAARNDILADLLTFPARIWMAFDFLPELPRLLASKSGNCKVIPLVTDNLINSLNLTKRSFDIAVGTALLLLTAPLLLPIAMLVKLSGPGPIVFRQVRTGAHGHRFSVLKFRTMTHIPESPFAQASQNDQRVTRIGKLLRRSSLDELLQLINVLKGDMSLVGPRPHAPETQVQGMTFEDAVKLYRLRHRVRPGITGLAQIRGHRGETSGLESLELRLASDLEYIERWSIWLDIQILLRTLPVMISSKNAY